jgi:hypothetical protein
MRQSYVFLRSFVTTTPRAISLGQEGGFPSLTLVGLTADIVDILTKDDARKL